MQPVFVQVKWYNMCKWLLPDNSQISSVLLLVIFSKVCFQGIYFHTSDCVHTQSTLDYLGKTHLSILSGETSLQRFSWTLPAPPETSSSKLILWSWSWLPCPGQIGQNMLQDSFSWTGRSRLNIINNYYTFSGVIMIFSHSFCLILGWRKSIISS